MEKRSEHSTRQTENEQFTNRNVLRDDSIENTPPNGNTEGTSSALPDFKLTPEEPQVVKERQRNAEEGNPRGDDKERPNYYDRQFR